MSVNIADKARVQVGEVCWCGTTGLIPSAHPDYLTCPACGTAKLKAALAVEVGLVRDERSHVYGETYWQERQAELGLAPLEVRARTDLAERAQHWLSYLL